MGLKLYKGRNNSPNYYMRGSVRGIHVDESTGTGKRTQAEEIRARRENDLLEASIHGRSAVASFASAAVGYLEQGGEPRYLTPLIHYFGTRKLSEIDQAAIDECAKRLKPIAARSTVNRQIYTPISAVMKHASLRGMCEFRPVKRPRQMGGKTRWLSIEEAEALLGASSKHLRPLLTFMLYTGCRLAEAVYLDWKSVDLERAHVAFLDTKNGESRGVPLHPEIISALSEKPAREGFVFRRPDGRPYVRKGHDDGGGQIKTAFKGACRRAGLAGVTPHTLRHTWATWFYREHRDVRRLMELGGWKSTEMVMRYAHVNSDEHAAAISALPKIVPENSRKSKNGN